MKKNEILLMGGCLAASLLAPAILAQEPSPPKPPRPARTARVYVSHGGGSFLGIGVVEVDAERAKALKLKEERGVEVKSVDEDSPAAKAGIKEGDVVLDFNGQRVEGTEQFVRLVRETPPGRQCTLLISRNGATQTLTATIGQRSGAYISRDGGPLEIRIPSIPPIPPIPDLPHSNMSWRSTMLGVESESLSSQLAEYFGVKEGVLVRSVIKGSAAEKAGIKAGDVIVKVDDTHVTSPREITSVMRGLRAKRTFPVQLVRKQQEMTVTVTLEETPRMRGVRPVVLAARSC